MTRLLVLVAASLLAVAACTSGSGQRATTSTAALDQATVRTARCTDWNAAPVTERWRLVRGMRDFFGGEVDSPGLRGQVLPDHSAYQLFSRYCSQPFAAAFNLYRLYGNAAAFTAPRN